MGDGFYRSNDPTNSIKVLKEMLQRKKQRTKFNNPSMNKAIDVAQNHPLWRLMSMFGAMHSPSGACHTRRRRRPKSGGKLSTICGGGGVGRGETFKQCYLRPKILLIYTHTVLHADILHQLPNLYILQQLLGKPFDGRPVVIAGCQRLECRYGPHRTKKIWKKLR